MADCPEQHEDTTIYLPTGFRRIGLWLVGMLYRLWAKTIRLDMDEASSKAVNYRDEPVVIVMWHNSLFMAPICNHRFRKPRQVYGLISASRDGGGLAYFFGLVGIGAIRGSSSRFGREGFNNLIRCHAEGNDITVTPDGPRGPVYVMKPGAVLAVRRARSKVLFGGFVFENAWRLKSWDRFYLPKPFSRVWANAELLNPEDIPPGKEGVAFLQGRMRNLTGELREAGTEPKKARSPL